MSQLRRIVAINLKSPCYKCLHYTLVFPQIYLIKPLLSLYLFFSPYCYFHCATLILITNLCYFYFLRSHPIQIDSSDNAEVQSYSISLQLTTLIALHCTPGSLFFYSLHVLSLLFIVGAVKTHLSNLYNDISSWLSIMAYVGFHSEPVQDL